MSCVDWDLLLLMCAMYLGISFSFHEFAFDVSFHMPITCSIKCLYEFVYISLSILLLQASFVLSYFFRYWFLEHVCLLPFCACSYVLFSNFPYVCHTI
jgi:hypothetical protein